MEERMRKTLTACGAAIALILSQAIYAPVQADDLAKTRTSGSTKPGLGSGPAEQKSLPSSAPPATTTQTTGATHQDPTVKAMNRNEEAKVNKEGK
jgi:hypothetical protein